MNFKNILNKVFKIKSEDEKIVRKENERIYQNMKNAQKANLLSKKEAPGDDAYISLRHINKIYENRVQAVFDFNIDIKKNEFIVFVGPSGCGKSTTLRMIAGLESITYGDLFIDKVLANNLEPKDRDIAMVFQSYALYPHMTVYDNLAFSLKIKKYKTLIKNSDGSPKVEIDHKIVNYLKRKIKNIDKEVLNEDEKANRLSSLKESLEYYETSPVEIYRMRHKPHEEIDKAVKKVAETLELTPYLARKPQALSGGQRQRVALGRAIVRNAKLFLMDEPLSNLDAKLRVQMRSEIVKLHRSIGATTIYVTHDQTEAMTMADRIVVMKDGYVQQIGTPKEIYSKPSNIFVAIFIGSPAMNLIDAKYDGNSLIFDNGYKIKLDYSIEEIIKEYYEKSKQDIIKQNIEIDKEIENINSSENSNEMRLKFLNKKKSENDSLIDKYKLALENKNDSITFGIRPEDIYHHEYVEAKAIVSNPFEINVDVAELIGSEYYIYFEFDKTKLIAKVPSNNDYSVGDKVKLVMNINKIHIFDKISSKRIL